MKTSGLGPRIAVLVLMALAAPRMASEAGAATGTWWSYFYSHRMKVTVSAGSSPVLAGYTVSLTFDHATLVTASKSLASGDDVRVAYWNGASWSELDRIIDTASSWNVANTTILFRTQATISASGSDDNYYLYYSNPNAVFPPVNPSKVYLLSDGLESGDFENWVGAWNTYGDSLNVVNASVVAPNSGTGADGPITISGSTNITSVGGLATAVTANPSGTRLVVTSTAGFAAGDEVILIDQQGVPSDTDDVGKYELLKIASVLGGTRLNLQTPVRRSYDGASFAAQKVFIQRVPQWTTVTINSGGTLTASPWNGTTGGIVAFRATGAVTINAGGAIDANALGYRGGTGGGGTAGGLNGESYDGYVGSGGDDTVSGAGGGALGTDGGGASSDGGPAVSPFTPSPAGYRGGGGGGGNADASATTDGAGGGGGGGYGGGGGGGGGGGDGTIPGSGGTGGTTGVGAGGGGSGGNITAGAGGNAGSAGGGTADLALAGGWARTGQGGHGDMTVADTVGGGGGGGGGQYGYADLATRICFGSGGGGGGDHDNGSLVGQPGGAGGGIIFIAADSVSNSGTIRANGGNGTSTTDRRGAGGGGSGGSILIHANSVTNSATLTATGGSGGAGSGVATNPGGGGGAGGVGRIRIEATSITGTTNPTYFSATGNPVHTGTYSAMAVTDNTDDTGPDNGAQAMSIADFPEQSAIYASGWFYLSSTFPSTDYVALMQAVSLNPWWQNLLSVTMQVDRTLYVQNAATSPYEYYYPAIPTPLAVDTWHHIEMQIVISQTVGEIKVWLDGSLHIDATNKDTEATTAGTQNVERFAFGNYWQGDYVDANTLYFDDAFINALVTPGATTALAGEETTAVTLIGFSASGLDWSVLLEWRTGSEVDNLGFQLYRSLSPGGPWTRLTSSLIPGQGFSAMGAAYAWQDTGLTNGVPYFYRLEDVDTRSVSTFHGPVSAVPQVGATTPPPSEGGGDGGPDPGPGSGRSGPCPSWALDQLGSSSSSYTCETYGDPYASSFRVLSRSRLSALVGLQTHGFLAARDASGRVRALIPGFDSLSSPTAPALPLKRASIAGVVGWKASIRSIEAQDLSTFPGLAPAAVGYPQAVVSADGTVSPGRREASLAPRARGVVPREEARLAAEGFLGEEKTLFLEMVPLRFDASHGALVLARRLIVRIDFTSPEVKETGQGRLGRRIPKAFDKPDVYAFLATSRTGLHCVSFESLFPGRSRALKIAALRLTREQTTSPSGTRRRPVPFHVLPESPFFGPGSRLFFDADALPASTSFSSEVVYALRRGRGGRQMGLLAAPADGSAQASSLARASFEANRIFVPDVLDAADLWQWEVLASGFSKTESFSLEGLDSQSPEPARLVVFLQGGSDTSGVVDHHVQVAVNGVVVAEEAFDRALPHRVSADLPPSLLRTATNNDLTLTNLGDTGVFSRVFLDRFEVRYPQTSAARAGVFDGSFAFPGTAEIAGLSSPIALLDLTADPVWLTGYEAGASLRFRAEPGHRYLAVSEEALLTPRVFFPEPSARLRSTANQADYVLVAPQDFLAAAQPLLARRRSQGLTTFAASLEEIAASFGGGQVSAEAVHDFLTFAYQSWARPSPRYVLLLGDSNYDPRRFNPASQPSPMPHLLLRTSYLWTASDPALASVNGEDLLPDLALGRLPATTLEQAQTMVAKILDWEDQGFSLDGKIALVADNPDPAGDFEADVRDIQDSFLQGRETTEILYGRIGDRDTTRAEIIDAMNNGLSLISYVGHGGGAVWASENIFGSSDAASLLSQPEQPLMLTMNCLNGYFIAPRYESLAESFLKVEGTGTIAAFSPSGLSIDAPAHLFHRAVMREITSGQHERLGDVILAAQRAYAGTGAAPELLSIYHLFGDPALKIR